MSRVRHGLQAHGAQAGSALIEVMVSATILLVAVVALFLALDVHTSASGDARASSAAANLAEADQDRLRGFALPDLVDRNETTTKVVQGDTYTVASRTDWVRDATGGTQSCSSSSTPADYLSLTSTVTSPSGGALKLAPVTLRSVVAAPVGQFAAGKGSLAVNTVGGAGQAIAGVTASIGGAVALSGTTNAFGCAVFGYVPAGSYQVQAAASGYVDPAGNATANATATAAQATVNLTSLQYDRAGTVNVSFDTKVGSAAAKPATSTALSAANAGVPTTGLRLFQTSTAQTTIGATSLFPFPSAYTLYSGTCTSANPAKYSASYFSSNPGSVVVAPGATTAVTVREPALQFQVTTATAGTAVHVRARSVDSGCSDVFDWNVTTAGSGKSATLPEPGLPFGNYSVCADSGGKYKNYASNPVALTTAGGMATQQTISLTSGTTTGTCP